VSDPSSRRRRARGLVVIAAAVAVLIIAAGAGYAVIGVRQHQQAAGLRPSGIPASVSTSLANLMQLSPVPVTNAPGFTLTDQGGHAMSLASLRGRVVVLDFMDPHCTDICPIVSQEFTDAYRDLGASAPQVVFLAVNVNRYHLQVADTARFYHRRDIRYLRVAGLDEVQVALAQHKTRPMPEFDRFARIARRLLGEVA